MLNIDFRDEKGVAVVDLEGFIDGGPASDALRELIKGRLTENQKAFLLNFQDVDWVNSRGVGVLVGAYASAQREDATVKLCGLSNRVNATFEACGVVPKMFEVYPDEEAGVCSFIEG